MMLYKLLSHSDRDRFPGQVISLTDVGSVGERIRALGVDVRALEMQVGLPDPRAVMRLTGWVCPQRPRPRVVQTWMYHADLIGGMAARLSGLRPALVWNVRQ